ncbi:MAG: hypothetical protein ACUVX9_00335 [Anaerolineae bacterium]
MRRFQRPDIPFFLLLGAFALYAAAYIYRTSFVLDGERYFALFDDCMVSMTYARNLAQGHGLVWYPGAARVEGYTNPLWVLFMAAIHLLPVALSKTSLIVQLAGALLLAANLVCVRRMADLLAPGSAFAGLAAPLLCAFYLPLNTWGLQGTEVSLLALIVTSAAWQALRALRANKPATGLYLLLGAATLVRLDMAVSALAIIAYLAVVDRENRRRHLLSGLGVLALFILGQTLLRSWYYGDPLPNTYYLKMTGYPVLLRMSRGLYVALEFAWPIAWLLIVTGLGALFFRRDRQLPLLVWLLAAQVAYSVYVGGDAWEWWGGANRYIAIAMPVFFVGFVCVLSRVSALPAGLMSVPQQAVQIMRTKDQQGATEATETTEWGACPVPSRSVDSVALCALCGSGSPPAEKRREGALSYARWGLVALAFVSFTSFQPGPEGRQTPADWLLLNPPLHVAGNRDTAAIARLVRQVTTSEARVGIVWAGAIPYFSERPCVDLLGKNDRVIAHLPMRLSQNESRSTDFYPGHLKWDYAYSLGELRPDVVVQLWQAPWEAQPFLDALYVKVNVQGFDFYLLKGSDKVLWERV